MRTTAPAAATHRALRDRAARPYVLNGHAASAPALPGGLYLVATPIGNLRDITVRALEVLAAAEVWLAQNADDRIRDIRFDAMLVAPGRIPRHIPAAFDAGG